ncbi:hypothetical protein AHAS_Ahas02G0049200 [Arachis hypogaea]
MTGDRAELTKQAGMQMQLQIMRGSPLLSHFQPPCRRREQIPYSLFLYALFIQSNLSSDITPHTPFLVIPLPTAFVISGGLPSELLNQKTQVLGGE